MFLLLAAGLLAASCKKDLTEQKVKTHSPSKDPVMQTEDLTKLDYFKLLAEKFLSTAENSTNFKRWIYSQCHAQDSGDYYISVYDLLDRNEDSGYLFWTEQEADYIHDEILDNIKIIDDDSFTVPVVFVPFIEDLDIDSLKNNCPTGAPYAVISMEYDSVAETCPGYYLNGETLSQTGTDVTESYAWSHDLWVFGQEEELSPENMIGGRSINYRPDPADRTNGQAEYGGIIQVTKSGGARTMG